MSASRKKVLIISYYWPPAGGVAVQRWYKFATYLSEFGFDPIIYTVQDGEFGVLDESKDDLSGSLTVMREPIKEPYKLYKKFTGKKKDEKVKQETFANSGGKEGFAIWVRGNFFIPDARKFWIKRSISRLSQFILENQIDAIVSNGTPHSCHLIGLGLKKKFGLPWLADFRDPWTLVDYFDQLRLSEGSKKKHQRLEKDVLENADVVSTVSWAWEKDFQKLGAKKTVTITNGFDSADFQNVDPIKDENHFVLTHLGTLSKYRFHQEFWDVILKKYESDEAFRKDLKIQLVGNVDHAFHTYFTETGLLDSVEYVTHVEHNKALSYTAGADVQLLLLGDKSKSEGRIPAKVYEYMAAKRPILAYGQVPSDVEKIVRESKSGEFVGFDDLDHLSRVLDALYLKYKNDEVDVAPTGIEKFERRNLTEQLAFTLSEITS